MQPKIDILIWFLLGWPAKYVFVLFCFVCCYPSVKSNTSTCKQFDLLWVFLNVFFQVTEREGVTAGGRVSSRDAGGTSTTTQSPGSGNSPSNSSSSSGSVASSMTYHSLNWTWGKRGNCKFISFFFFARSRAHCPIRVLIKARRTELKRERETGRTRLKRCCDSCCVNGMGGVGHKLCPAYYP